LEFAFAVFSIRLKPDKMKWTKGGLVLLAVCLVGSCKPTPTTGVPVWEFDVTVNGEKSHFKSTNASKDWLWYANRYTENCASAVSQGGKWTIQCNGNSVGDTEWVAGSGRKLMLVFNESTNEVELLTVNGLALWTSDGGAKLTASVLNYGTASATNQASNSVQFGTPFVLKIPPQVVSNSLWPQLSIEGTIKALR
jgi:hypothetical protein